MERKTLSFKVGKPILAKLLTDSPKTGQSKFGKWYLFSFLVIKGEEPGEYGAFLPEKPALALIKKGLKANDYVVIMKVALEKETPDSDGKLKKSIFVNYLVHSLEEAIKFYSEKLSIQEDFVKTLKAFNNELETESLTPSEEELNKIESEICNHEINVDEIPM